MTTTWDVVGIGGVSSPIGPKRITSPTSSVHWPFDIRTEDVSNKVLIDNNSKVILIFRLNISLYIYYKYFKGEIQNIGGTDVKGIRI